MSKILFLKGLPASGKTTFAKELAETEGWYRVNKDDIRLTFPWYKENEVIAHEDCDIEGILGSGANVVVDDTNFNPIHEKRIRAIADYYRAEFEIKFFDVPVEECIMRDSLREKSVGEKVIRDMYEKYLNVPPKIEYNPDLPDAYIFDIDGTLAKRVTDRGFYDWKRVGEDVVNEDVYRVLLSLVRDGKNIIIVSGRDSICKKETTEWLTKNNIPFNELGMREEGDNRKDNIIKLELYNNFIRDNYNILGVFDDRDSVVKMWRDIGLTCFQVAPGNF